MSAHGLLNAGWTADQCIKCNICMVACPVLAVSDSFLGPKAVGPQAERFRHPRQPFPDATVSLCSGCGACTRVCPHGVAIAEMNTRAKARLVEKHGAPLRDHIIARPGVLGQLARPVASLANRLMDVRVLRGALHHAFGIHQNAPLPRFAGKTFRQLERRRLMTAPPEGSGYVAYYHGCSTNHYEPQLGRIVVEVLEHLDCRVLIPPQVCCGLPLQSNGLFKPARRYGEKNLDYLKPFVSRGIPIIGSSTSCTLQLKHEYRAVLGLNGRGFEDLAYATQDVFEFIVESKWTALKKLELKPFEARILYHAPCQLKSHWMGMPALAVLRLIPGLEIHLSNSECCGIAGTYGVKREKYQIAQDVGGALFKAVEEIQPDLVLTDSETCRWWITANTGVDARHPIEVLARSMSLPSSEKDAGQ